MFGVRNLTGWMLRIDFLSHSHIYPNENQKNYRDGNTVRKYETPKHDIKNTISFAGRIGWIAPKVHSVQFEFGTFICQ